MKLMLMIPFIPQESPHNCSVHSCILSSRKIFSHKYGQLQPCGEQHAPKMNFTSSLTSSSDEFYVEHVRKWIPKFIKNSYSIPKFWYDDNKLAELAPEWEVIMETQNRIKDDHRTFFELTKFPNFLKLYKQNPFYSITALPPQLQLTIPNFMECKMIKNAIHDQRLWMSNGNTSSSIHFDTHDTLLLQIDGTKEVYIWPPENANSFYMDSHTRYGLSPINVDKVDLIKFPEFGKIQPYFIYLTPGDQLYIPNMWWHQLKSHPGRNVMLSLEFEFLFSHKIKPQIYKLQSYLKTVEYLKKRMPTTCNYIIKEKYSITSKYGKSCEDFCYNTNCNELNGNYEHECSGCPSNFKCNQNKFNYKQF